jgi:hypothetical protein
MADNGAVAKFQENEEVYVPAASLKDPNTLKALVRRRVIANVGRSIVVNDYDDKVATIASGLVHKGNIGILVLRVGDFSTEDTLLDPLADSLAQFLRLLIDDGDIDNVRVRTLAELEAYWAKQGESRSHVILIAHGSEKSITFVGDGAIGGSELAARLISCNPLATNRWFISLACKTGRVDFANAFSRSSVCRDLVAPFQSVHGAAASQFCQALLTLHFLRGHTLPIAYRVAAKEFMTQGTFVRWSNGVRRGPSGKMLLT